MMNDPLTYVPISSVVALCLIIFYFLCGSAAQRTVKPDPETGELLLRCSGFMIWTMTVLAVLPGILACLVLVVAPKTDTARHLPMLGLFGGIPLFVMGGGALWVAGLKTRIGTEGLATETVLGAAGNLSWADVTRVVYRRGLNGWVHGKDGKKVQLYLWFVGIRNAVPFIWEKLPEGVLRDSKHALQRLAKAAQVDPKLPRPAVWQEPAIPAISALPTYPGRGA